ncbi:MAG: hypothetical protein FWC78_00755 [Defluviitaleaceae bacterium]|nr:hypothetical protein [Defluviitaleaceae bacterium]
MSIYQNQKSIKPKPEDVAADFLDNKKTELFLDIIDFIRADKINISWVSGNSWGLNVKGKRIAFLKICNGNWIFRQQPRHMKFYNEMKNDDLKNFVCSYICAKTCIDGTCDEHPNMPKTDFNAPNVCTCWPLRIYDPDKEALEYTKQLIAFSKKYILNELQVMKA